MTSDLVAFLRARLDEDEQTARAAVGTIGKALGWAEIHTAEMRREQAHVDRHTPERVLAEVDTKRQIMNASNAACAAGCSTEHTFSGSCSLRWMGPVHKDATGRWLHDDTGARFTPPPVITAWTLRLLALPYAGHPDYQPEWTPST
ncbi:DUF6221 family protein [Kitasatospora sp. NPDC048298]|uniref:DUF6221 family protein n=1 Tax=Kitasatospora sp. NPDC048298 TaxID=3364049 RepID=UPI00371DF95D